MSSLFNRVKAIGEKVEKKRENEKNQCSNLSPNVWITGICKIWPNNHDDLFLT